MRVFNAEERSLVTVKPPNLSHELKYEFDTWTWIFVCETVSEYELKIFLSSKPDEYEQRTYTSFSCESSVIVFVAIDLTVSGMINSFNFFILSNEFLSSFSKFFGKINVSIFLSDQNIPFDIVFILDRLKSTNFNL